MPQNSLKFIDLFAGLGGFHLALQSLGHECVFASEIKEDLRQLYKINFPHTPIICGDITQHLDDVPAHDILCAGFPCQPFSQAGYRQGFEDEKGRGNLFDYICEIIKKHRPKYVFLENVSNLMGHDGGRTWFTIRSKLMNLDYADPHKAILSPHQFGIPQHRKRIYIVTSDNQQVTGGSKFEFPCTDNHYECSIARIVDEDSIDFTPLKDSTRHQLDLWQEFIDRTIASGDTLPSFPVWAMEFGADYPFNPAPAFQSPLELRKYHGTLGKPICGETLAQCLICLPKYSRTDKTEHFPAWKMTYIRKNRNFYERHHNWLDEWLKKMAGLQDSHLKFEWNCGSNAKPILHDKIIQFRASGIRVKLPNYSPALNLVGTQVPILPWVKLPVGTFCEGESDTGRYMTVAEAARLQGMEELCFTGLSTTRCYEALGNAVNVDIVRMIAKKLISTP